MNHFLFVIFTAVTMSSGDWIERTFSPQPHFQSLPISLQKVPGNHPSGVNLPWIFGTVSGEARP